MKSIFDYDNVQEYLRDWHKEYGTFLGYRTISQLLNAQSPSYFYKILNGEKPIPVHKVELFIRLFKLNAAEARYFIVLSLISRPRVPRATRESILKRFGNLKTNQRLLRGIGKNH